VDVLPPRCGDQPNRYGWRRISAPRRIVTRRNSRNFGLSQNDAFQNDAESLYSRFDCDVRKIDLYTLMQRGQICLASQTKLSM